MSVRTIENVSSAEDDRVFPRVREDDRVFPRVREDDRVFPRVREDERKYLRCLLTQCRYSLLVPSIFDLFSNSVVFGNSMFLL